MKTKRRSRVIGFILAITLILSCLSGMTLTAFAVELSGSCGRNLTWSLDRATGTLTISGTGEMEDFYSAFDEPWADLREDIEEVIIEYGVTSIGERAFSEYEQLKKVTIQSSVVSIGDFAFYRCLALEEVVIPNSVTYIGLMAFSSSSLSYVHYCGSEEEWNRNVTKLDKDYVFESSLEFCIPARKSADSNRDHICDICGTMTPCFVGDSGLCSICGARVARFKLEASKLYVSYDNGYSWEEIGNVADGKSVVSIEKTGTNGNVDTYTVTYSDGSTSAFTVTNGEDGADGVTPKFKVENSILFVSYDGGATWTELGSLKGEQGSQGIPGQDGHTPVIEIKDGYWYIDGVNTNVQAAGSKGQDGITPQLRINSAGVWEVSYDSGATWTSLGISAVGANGTNGTNGADGKDGKDGANGKNGADGITPQLRINESTNVWEVSYDNGKTWTSMGVAATGAAGKDGETSVLPLVISCISLAGMVVMLCVMMADRRKRSAAARK